MAERSIRRPPYDIEIAANLADSLQPPLPATHHAITQFRQAELLSEGEADRIAHIRLNTGISEHHLIVPGPRGDIPVLMLCPSDNTRPEEPQPGIVFYHGGGMLLCTPYFGIVAVSHLVAQVNAVVFSVDYNRAPEVQGTALAEDCYTALVWVAENFSRLNIDMSRLMVAGVSAGGGLAAAAALMARDRQGPKLCAQLLVCPMLDDRCATISCKQFEQGPMFNTTWARKAWSWVLGEQPKDSDVSMYAAPGRAEDLSELPEAYIDAGSAEVFRDEAIAYAGKLWRSGGQAHLHIWGGGCHRFDTFEEHSTLSTASIAARNSWLARILKRST